MTPYNQHNYQDQLGTCPRTIATDGCFVTSLACLCDTLPPEVNNLLRDNGGYASGCLVIGDRAGEILGLEYDGKVQAWDDSTCIAETNIYANKGYPQHFFVLLADGMIMDPLIGEFSTNHYPIENIISYRLFKPKGDNMPFRDIVWNVVNGWFINYFNRQATQKELDTHTNSIVDSKPTEYALSNWINSMKKEAEFKKNWISPKDCPSADCSKIQKELDAYKLQLDASTKLLHEAIGNANICEKNKKDLEAEQIKIMQEHEKVLQLLDDTCKNQVKVIDNLKEKLADVDKKIADAVAIAVKDCQARADATIDYYSASQLIVFGLRKFLGLK